ncbi:MAG TPA: hypothetical protein GXX18_04215 [Bacillales bacterium]|nr:hypothetical protein [Bacillales bacterium]
MDDLSEFGSGFEFFIEEKSNVEIEFDVHSDTVVPKDIKGLTKTGKLSVNQMPKTQYFDLQQEYICSCVLRIASDMFSIDYVIIHTNDDIFDSSTGHSNKKTILSVKIERRTLNRLNLDTIDCSDAMQNFQHNMKFLKTKGMQPIVKLDNIN